MKRSTNFIDLIGSSSSSSEEDVFDRTVSIVTPEKPAKRRARDWESEQESKLVHLLMTRRMERGYSSDSQCEDMPSLKGIVRRKLFVPATPVGKAAYKTSIDAAQPWAHTVPASICTWWGGSCVNPNAVSDFLLAVIGPDQQKLYERFTKWSLWNSATHKHILSQDTIPLLSDYVRLIMRTLVFDQAFVFQDFVRSPLIHTGMLEKALTTSLGGYKRTLMHAIAMHPQADSFIYGVRLTEIDTLELDRDVFGLTPLHLATLNKDITDGSTICNILNIDRSQQETREINGGCTPFHFFLLGQHEGITRDELKRVMRTLHVDMDAFTEQRSPALVAASNPIDESALQVVTTLWERGLSNLLRLDVHGFNVLHVSCSQGSERLVAFLLECLPHQCRTQQCLLQGSTPLHVAAAGGTQAHAQCIRLMVEKFKTSDTLDCLKDHQGWPPLLYALFSNRLPAVRALLEIDEALVDPTRGQNPQLKQILSLIETFKLKLQRLMHALVKIPEFFEYFNRFVGKDIGLLEGPLGFFVDTPETLSIENKVKLLDHRAMAATREANLLSTRKILVERPVPGKGVVWLANLARALNAPALGQRIEVRFMNLNEGIIVEPGYGEGPTREFFAIVGQIINKELFACSPDGQRILPGETHSSTAYTMAGVFTALSLISKGHMDLSRVSPLLWEYVAEGDIGYVPDVEKLAEWDPELANSLRQVARTDLETNPDIQVVLEGTDKYRYISEAVRSRILTEGMMEFRTGFFKVISEEWVVDFFTAKELAIVLGSDGVCQVINVHDWRTNTTYLDGYTADSKQVKWFWELVVSLPVEEQRLVLMFATGMTAVPIGGFANLTTTGGDCMRFAIARTVCREGPGCQLPTAATCFNLLRLPDYPTQEILNDKVLTAIRLGSQGFDFA